MQKRLKYLSNEKGNSLVELVMVMLLLVLFGVAIYTLIFAGSRTQASITENKRVQVDARIALSYLNVKLRQNDELGRLAILPHPQTGEPSILIRERGEWNLDTWIYFKDGQILEYLGDADLPPDDLSANIIVPINSFLVTYDEKRAVVTNTVIYEYNGQTEQMSNAVAIKSGVSVE